MKKYLADLFRRVAERIDPEPPTFHWQRDIVSAPLTWPPATQQGVCPNCGASFFGTHVCHTVPYIGPWSGTAATITYTNGTGAA